MEPIVGITVLYADDMTPFLTADYLLQNWKNWDYMETETSFHKIPQSKRIERVEDICFSQNGSKQKIAIITNDYHFIRMLELNMEPSKFQIYNFDTGETVSKFVDLNPNPTLAVGEYVFRASVKAALKGG